MIISSNKRRFVNTTTSSSGILRTDDVPTANPNEAFLGFKPVSVCKNAGFLSVSGSGFLSPQAPDRTVSLWMEFSKPGLHSFNVTILSGIIPGSSNSGYFTFHVDIPVGINGNSESFVIPLTSHYRSTSNVYLAGAYITADADELYLANIHYQVSIEAAPIGLNTIVLDSIITEYKEN
jgi:hypothetical protein